MTTILQYLYDNKEWIFSGVGIAIFSGAALLLKKVISGKNSAQSQNITGDGTGYQAGRDINFRDKT